MSRDQDVVYDTPININMHTAGKKKGIIDTLHFGKKECKESIFGIKFEYFKTFQP